MILHNFIAFCDAAEPWQLGLQDPASSTVEGMIHFHNYLMFYLVLIGCFVFWMLYYVVKNFNSTTNSSNIEKFTHSNTLEIVWTIIPAVLLVFIGIPSFALLYSLDEWFNPEVNLKIVGHQWYWSYEYSDSLKENPIENTIGFDSYLLAEADLVPGSFRLLEVDHKVILPVNTHIRLLVTAADVLHSWAVPSFGIKIDACPGRLSQGSLFIKREGVFYGQCSEICGVNHGFMPIAVKAVDRFKYLKWLLELMETTNSNLK
jgi:cytochrome c oxidase subunit 2